MKILIIDEVTGGADGATDQLERAGYDTVSCRPEDPRQVCRGVEPQGRCPLDDGVDVALAAFPIAEVDDQGLALGYVCARRNRIPVIAVGDASAADDDTVLVHDLHDIAAVVAGTASRPAEPHTRVAQRAVRESLDRHDLEEVDANVWVERSDGRLSIRVTTTDPIPKAVSQAVAVRALAAVRAVDGRAPSTGVSFV